MPQQHTGRQFKADHACRLIESRDEDNNGPAREAWKCDNDVENGGIALKMNINSLPSPEKKTPMFSLPS